MQVALDSKAIPPVSSSRQIRELPYQRRISPREQVQADGEGRYPFTGGRELDVALMFAPRHQILFVGLPTQLEHEMASIFGACMKSEETVQIGEYHGAKTTALLSVNGFQPGQALGGQDQVRPVLGQFGQGAFVIGT